MVVEMKQNINGNNQIQQPSATIYYALAEKKSSLE